MWQYGGRGLSFVTWQPPKMDESDPVLTPQMVREEIVTEDML